ncbi:MAG TPA: SRPBCC domain-containing protein [Euzebyales bacterium]|nr:SRPBCC domain-containing protein [Euzebyales bacterium]
MADIVIERNIAAPPDVLFAMFTEPDLLVRWLGDNAELDPVPGGVFRFTLADKDACLGRYVELDPPHRLVFTWGWERAEAIPVPAGSTEVTVELTPIATGTRLRLTHRGLDGDDATLHEHGWDRFLTRLGAVIDGVDPGPAPWAEHPDEVVKRVRQER